MMWRQLLIVVAVVVCTTSAANMERLRLLDRAMEALDTYAESVRALEEQEKREIWYVYNEDDTSATVELQRNQAQKKEDGLWMLQYKNLDDSTATWTDTKDGFLKWSELKVNGMEGIVQVTGLEAGTHYNLRTKYYNPAKPETESDAHIEPNSGNLNRPLNTTGEKRRRNQASNTDTDSDATLLKRLMELLSNDQ